MNSQLLLLPFPQKLIFLPDSYAFKQYISLNLKTNDDPSLRQVVQYFQHRYELIRNQNGDVQADSLQAGQCKIRLEPSIGIRPQGYRLLIQPDGITITGLDAEGAFNGVCTLLQIIQQHPDHLPCLEIEDWPDFPVRGIMVDISRDKVPTMDTLRDLIDFLAGWKINQLQLYAEHTFAYSQYPEIWKDASPLTAVEIRELDRYCTDRFIELVPNQNSFGHMNRWLINPRFAPLAEIQGDFETPWGMEHGPFSLCPLDSGSIELVTSLFDELLPNFTSRLINVGCDETFDLGQGRSKEACNRLGKGRIYIDFLKKIHSAVSARGYTMLFWADIIQQDILQQHPDLISELPRDAVALEWGYEADHPFEDHCRKLADVGLTFYVCPGTSSWDSITGRTQNMLDNIQNAAQAGLKFGAAGCLNTDWGDNGHWQMLPVSYLGFAAGAAFSWATTNQHPDLAQAVSLFVFQDPSGRTGKAFFEGGNIYHAAGFEPPNSSTLFWLLQKDFEELQPYTGLLNPDLLSNVEAAIDKVEKPDAQGRDGVLVNREFDFSMRLLKHACHRGRLLIENDPQKAAGMKSILREDLLEIQADYSSLWLQRNRPGGLKDSLARLTAMQNDY